jgi:hypothetical protein
MEQRSMFQYMYLQVLPCTLQTMLGEQEPGEIRCLAARADKPGRIQSIAAGHWRQVKASQVGYSICYSYWTFGARATRFEAPCSWVGN